MGIRATPSLLPRAASTRDNGGFAVTAEPP